MSVDYTDALLNELGGFDYSDVNRLLPKDIPDVRTYVKENARKTGTTIAAVTCPEGVVLAADTRATSGHVVADANCFKLHSLAANIWAAGAGVAGDLDHVTSVLHRDLELQARQMQRLPRVETVISRLRHKMVKYPDIICALLVAGINPDGKINMVSISPGGSSHCALYAAMGSGGYFARSVLEDKFRPDLTIDEAANLAAQAIEAGILNDEGSGSGCDIVIIRKNSPTTPELRRSFHLPVKHTDQKGKLPIPHRPIRVLKEIRTPLAQASTAPTAAMS